MISWKCSSFSSKIALKADFLSLYTLHRLDPSNCDNNRNKISWIERFGWNKKAIFSSSKNILYHLFRCFCLISREICRDRLRFGSCSTPNETQNHTNRFRNRFHINRIEVFIENVICIRSPIQQNTVFILIIF